MVISVCLLCCHNCFVSEFLASAFGVNVGSSPIVMFNQPQNLSGIQVAKVKTKKETSCQKSGKPT